MVAFLLAFSPVTVKVPFGSMGGYSLPTGRPRSLPFRWLPAHPHPQIDNKLQALLTEHGLECAPPLTTARLLDKLVSGIELSRRLRDGDGGGRNGFRATAPSCAEQSGGHAVSEEDGTRGGERGESDCPMYWFYMLSCAVVTEFVRRRNGRLAPAARGRWCKKTRRDSWNGKSCAHT